MTKTGLVMLGALPGIAAVYLLLTGYILARVRPVPIALAPATLGASGAGAIPPMYRRRLEQQPQVPATPVGV